MKRLTIIRHAKSSWSQAGQRDDQRPLNNRGVSDALLIGKYLNDLTGTPDWMISSPANRAVSTAKIIASATDYQAEIEIDPSFYNFGDDGSIMLNKTSTLSDNVESVFLFGHNETFATLAYRLSNHKVFEFPTCSILSAEFEIDSWTEITSASSIRHTFMKPKFLKE